MSKVAFVEALLKSFQFSLNERIVNRERKKEETVNEIRALEMEIAKLTESIKTKRIMNDTNDDEADDGGNDDVSNNNKSLKDDRVCLEKLLGEDCEEELKKEEFKLKQNMEKKVKYEVQKMKKKMKSLVVCAKENNLKMCLACGMTSLKLPSCSGCSDAFYCNETCQERHWKIHQFYCQQ